MGSDDAGRTPDSAEERALDAATMRRSNSDAAAPPGATAVARRKLVVQLLLSASLALLVAGAFAPLLTTHRFYVFSSTFSLLSGLRELAVNEQLALAILIGVFSLCVPIVKAIVMWVAASSQASGSRFLNVADRLGKWSMLEVFVAALLIVAVKLGPVANADLHYGAYLLAGAVVLSGIASQLLSVGYESKPVFSGAVTLTIGAVIGAIATAVVIGVLNPDLLSSLSFTGNPEARCIERVLRLDRGYALASTSEAEYVAYLREIDSSACPESFAQAFVEYVEAAERLVLPGEPHSDDAGLIERLSAWLGIASTKEDALRDAEAAWDQVAREAERHGVAIQASRQ